MRLSTTDFKLAVSLDEFRARWHHFLRPGDVLIVYHQRTYQLLQHVVASQPRCLVLKSIFGKWQSGFRSMEELMDREAVKSRYTEHHNRAEQRLAMAVALVEHLRARGGTLW